LPENVDVPLDYVESSLNFQGNYQNYVYRALKSLLPLRNLISASFTQEKQVYLPESHIPGRKTLILDLDETLIHADFEGAFSQHDTLINFSYGGEDLVVPILIRPGLLEFLHNISQEFEIFVFTASVKEYADAVLNQLDPENKYFKFRFYRQHCTNFNNKVFVKDLRILSNRQEHNLILVDNSLYSFANQISNGVLINSFYNDKDDRELFNLFSYLKNYLLPASDVRVVNDQFFNFASMIEEFSFVQCASVS
jgi:Dullard-like phosphatase family protein